MNNVSDSRTCIKVELEVELRADGDGRDVILLERLADVYDAGFCVFNVFNFSLKLACIFIIN